jgi:hypothetical protein
MNTNQLIPAPSAPVAFALDSARRAEFWSACPDALFDRDTVAAVRYIERQTLELEAIKGGGIQYRKVGRRVYYSKADVLAWMESHSTVVANTAQAAQTERAGVAA